VSVPLSIFANLMTPRWAGFWAKRSERARRASSAKAEAYERAIAWFTAHPTTLNTYLLHMLGQAALYLLLAVFVLVGLVATYIVQGLRPITAVGSLVPFDSVLMGLLSALGVVAATFCLVRFMVIATRMWQVVGDIADREGWPMILSNLTPVPPKKQDH
jgi:hypothetical protein